jgi:hypothetical protein
MNSTYKNIILKRLKFIIAGFLFITILPGNASVKNYGYQGGSEIDSLMFDNIYSSINPDSYNTAEANNEFPGKFSKEAGEIKYDSVGLYVHQGREISPDSKSVNFFLLVQ